MHWFEIWECLMENKTLAKLNRNQRQFLPQLKERAAAVKGLNARRRRHKKKYKTIPTKGAWLSFDYKYIENYETAKYLEVYYDENFKKREKPLIAEPHDSEAGRSAYGSRAPLTKNKNYRHQKYRKKIKKARAEQKKTGKAYDYEKVLQIFYLCLPTHAFKSQEWDVIREIFNFALKKKLVFRVTKRSSRRNTEKLKMTYSEFCVWYAQNKAEYSCKDRFFVPLFCKNNAFVKKKNISNSFVDNLLRYDIFPECFTENDLKVIGVEEDTALFFDIMERIRKTSKKK